MNQIAEHVYQEHNFIIDSSKTVFYGLCGECRRKQEESDQSEKNK